MTPGTMSFYYWYNPEANSDKCRIKVVATDVGLNESDDVSGNFTIYTTNTSVNTGSTIDNTFTLTVYGQKYPLPYSDNVTMKIFSVKGQHLYTQNWKTITHNIYITAPALPAGVYLMRLQSDRDVAEYRVVLK